MKITEGEESLINRDSFPLSFFFLEKFNNLSNIEFYKLYNAKNTAQKNSLRKRLELSKKILNINSYKSELRYTLEKEDEERIMALFMINSNLPLISETLGLTIYSVKRCIEKEHKNFLIKYCDACGVKYLSRKVHINNKIIETPCPHCYEFTKKYPNETEPEYLRIPAIKDDLFLERQFSYLRKLKQKVNVYKKAKQKGVFSKNKSETMQTLYEGLLWMFGKTTVSFPVRFIDVCNALGENPIDMRENLLNFLLQSEIDVMVNLRKQKVRTLRIAKNLIDFIEIASYYATLGAESKEILDYFTEKYIQCNIPLLYKFSL